MLKTTFVITVAFIMSGLLYSCNQTKKESVLPQLIKEGAVLIDVRSSEEFAEGSVPGAINMPLTLLPYNLEKLEKDKPIIVFCKSGNRAGKAKKILEENNITNVTNGGSWQNVKAALEEAEKEPEPEKEPAK